MGRGGERETVSLRGACLLAETRATSSREQIFGTEEDKVNCPFYLKMGACRHGDRCSRIHNRPILSQTLLLQNMYVAPKQEFDAQTGQPLPQDERAVQDHFEDFYEDIFEELTSIGGELEQLRVCENLSDHLSGNVYAKFYEEEDAERALNKLVVRPPTARPPTAPRHPCQHARVCHHQAYDHHTLSSHSLLAVDAHRRLTVRARWRVCVVVVGTLLRGQAHPRAVLPRHRLQGRTLPPV